MPTQRSAQGCSQYLCLKPEQRQVPVTGRQATHFGMLLRWAATEQQNENTDAHSPDEEPSTRNTVMCTILYDSIIKQ